MGTLLLKLHTRATEDDGAYNSYYFRESTNDGTVQIQVVIELAVDDQGVLFPSRAHCLHYTGHMMWASLFDDITEESTDKFTWTGNDEMSAADALAESIAKSAFALLR